MIDHLNAIKAVLADLVDGGVHVGHARTDVYPYIVLSAPSWGSPGEVPVCGRDETLDVLVRVKAVAGTDAGVRTILAQVRDRLSPGLRWGPLAVPGRKAETKFLRAEFVGPDTSTTITVTDRTPMQGVDTYRLHSQPA